MKKIFYSILAIVAIFTSQFVVAQSRTSYFMEGSYFRTEMNPALTPTRGYLALPMISGVGQSYSSNFMSIDNFIYRRDGQLVTALNSAVSSDEFLGRLPELCANGEKLNVNFWSLGFFTNKIFWSIGTGAHFRANTTISKDLFAAVKTLGNGVYDLGDTSIDGDVYFDVYLGASFPVCDWMNIGVKGKFLIGVLNIQGEFDQVSANVGVDSVTGVLRGQWRGNGIFVENKYITPDGTIVYPNQINPNSVSYVMGNLKSFGAAIDLGFETRFFDDHLKFSAAVVDLGFIKWAPETHIGGNINGSFSYEGVDLETMEPKVESNFNDNFLGLSSYDGYKSMLNCSVNVGAEYNVLSNRIAFGLLSHTEFCKNIALSELTASVNYRATNWLTATVSHTFFNKNRPGIFGAALNIHPSVINIFVGADFIDVNLVKYTNKTPDANGLFPESMNPLYLPRYAKSINIYFGCGFNFGRPEFIRQKDSKNRDIIKSKRESRRES